jgi:hypothetical protein
MRWPPCNNKDYHYEYAMDYFGLSIATVEHVIGQEKYINSLDGTTCGSDLHIKRLRELFFSPAYFINRDKIWKELQTYLYAHNLPRDTFKVKTID